MSCLHWARLLLRSQQVPTFQTRSAAIVRPSPCLIVKWTIEFTSPGEWGIFLHFHRSCLPISVWRYPKSERNRIRNFFRYHIFFRYRIRYFFDTKFFRYRTRYFFRYQIFSIPNPKPCKKWKSFENELFRNRDLTQNTQNLNETQSEIFSDTKF